MDWWTKQHDNKGKLWGNFGEKKENLKGREANSIFIINSSSFLNLLTSDHTAATYFPSLFLSSLEKVRTNKTLVIISKWDRINCTCTHTWIYTSSSEASIDMEMAERMTVRVMQPRRRRSNSGLLVDQPSDLPEMLNVAGYGDGSFLLKSILLLSFFEQRGEERVVQVHHRHDEPLLFLLLRPHPHRYAPLRRRRCRQATSTNIFLLGAQVEAQNLLSCFHFIKYMWLKRALENEDERELRELHSSVYVLQLLDANKKQTLGPEGF